MDIGSLAFEGIGITYPASLAQERFWILDALDPGSSALNVAVRWTLLGPATPAAVEAALRRIIMRHEILRTGLIEVDGAPVQLVQPTVAFQLRHHDLSPLGDGGAAEADRLGAEEARTPFCLETPPLIRAALLTLSQDHARLLVTIHHAACDGWSIGVLAEEFTAALVGAPRVAELPLQYGDYAEWQQAWLKSAALEPARAYWTRQLAQLPYVAVPPDLPSEQRGPGAIASILLPRAVRDAMAATAVTLACTQFTVALAALGQMLQRRTGAEDIPIGTQVAGRTDVELEDMIGPFINTLVLRLDLSGDLDREARIKRARMVVESALLHHAMPFEALIRLLNPPRDRRRTPLFAINFIFQRSFVAPVSQGDIRLMDMPSHSAGALYDLNFFMVERPDGWRASCEYDAALYRPQTIQSMLDDWLAAMEGRALPGIAPAGDRVLEDLTAIWCESLGISHAVPADSFFDLGGHSLLAARMLARVEAVFGQRIGMAALFADPTLGGMGERLRGSPKPQQPDGGIQVLALGDAAEWPASLSQTHPVRHVTEADIATLAKDLPPGPVILLAAGPRGLAGLDLARSLQGRAAPMTLMLVDPSPPESGRGLLSRLRHRWEAAQAPYPGRTILFRRAATHQGTPDYWLGCLSGELDVVSLPPGPWQAVVTARLASILA